MIHDIPNKWFDVMFIPNHITIRFKKLHNPLKNRDFTTLNVPKEVNKLMNKHVWFLNANWHRFRELAACNLHSRQLPNELNINC